MCTKLELLECFVLSITILDVYYCYNLPINKEFKLMCAVSIIISNGLLCDFDNEISFKEFHLEETNEVILHTITLMLEFFNFKIYFETFDWCLLLKEIRIL